jgi:hypothetical protein
VTVTSSLAADVDVKSGNTTSTLETKLNSSSVITGKNALTSLLVSISETAVSQLYLSALRLPVEIKFYHSIYTTNPSSKVLIRIMTNNNA